MDSATFRVYQAEQSIDTGADLADVAAARALVRRVRRSAWWRDHIGPIPRISVRIMGRERDDWMESWASSNRPYAPDEWVLNLHPRMLNSIVVLHEMAHTIAPRYSGDLRQIKRGRVSWQLLPFHGPAFTALLAELLQRFGWGANHGDLAEAYQHFEVPRMTLDEVWAARALSERIEVAVLEQQFASVLATAEGTQTVDTPEPTDIDTDARQAAKIPVVEWGWWLRSMRRWRPGVPIVSRRQLAATISTIHRCTPQQIRTIEESVDPISDPVLRRIAMYAVAALNIDGVWARTELGLARWEFDLELEDLAPIGPQWVKDVAHLNQLVAARPPLWRSEGAR